MFSDMIGYTASMQKDEATALATASHYRQVLTEQVKIFGGQIIQHYGDGSLTVFPSSVAAVQCARDIQLILGAGNVVPLRIGIHLGDIVVKDSDIFGDGVNLASRVESIGMAQSVLMTRRVVEDLRSHAEMRTKYLGHFNFKNVSRPTAVYALASEGLVVPLARDLKGQINQGRRVRNLLAKPISWIILLMTLTTAFLIGRRQTSEDPMGSDVQVSMAVLPFRSLSVDPSVQYFSDGMVEMLRNYLSRSHKFTITSMTSVQQYRETEKSAMEIADELGVEYLLEGSVFRDSSTVRISAQLINGKSDTHIWVRDYDKSFSNLLQIQEELARDITTSLRIELNPASAAGPSAVKSPNAQAVDHYFRGMDQITRFTEEANEKGIGYFKEALVLDADFLVAKAGLSQAYFARNRRYGHHAEWVDSALQLAEEVVQVDPKLPEGQFALSLGYSAKGWREKALTRLLRTVELDPNYGPAIGNIGVQYYKRGSLDEAIRWYKKSLIISPDSYAIRSNLGSAYGYLSDFVHAKEWFDEAQRTNPDGGQAIIGKVHLYLAFGEFDMARDMKPALLKMAEKNAGYFEYIGELHRMLGDWEDAEYYFRKALQSDTSLADDAYGVSSLGLGFLALKSGDPNEAWEWIDRSLAAKMKFVDQGGTDKWILADVAYLLAMQEKANESMKWLQKAINAGWRDVQYASRDPYLEKLHTHEGYNDLMKGALKEIEKMKQSLSMEDDVILN